jgi:hypothetical protein
VKDLKINDDKKTPPSTPKATSSSSATPKYKDVCLQIVVVF